MLKFRSFSCNGVQGLYFIHNLHHLQHYSSSSSTLNSNSTVDNPIFVNYLVNSLGFSKEQAIPTVNKLRKTRSVKKVSDFDFIDDANSVVKFLKHIGLDESHIRKTIINAPNILSCDVDKTLTPRIEVFQKLGFSLSDFADVVKVSPAIFFTAVDNVIIPAIQALREILGDDQLVIELLKQSRCIRLHSVSRYLVPNVALLQNHGVEIRWIWKCLLMRPSTLFRQSKDLEDAVIKVEKLGIPRNNWKFLHGLQLFTALGESTIESKIEIFKSFGWSDADVRTLMGKHPVIFKGSADSLGKKLCFLMKECGFHCDFLLLWTSLFTYSLEKRMIPRHKVFLFLQQKELISLSYSPHGAMVLTESRFLKKFVLPFKEVHELYCKHTGLSMKALTQKLSELKLDAAC